MRETAAEEAASSDLGLNLHRVKYAQEELEALHQTLLSDGEDKKPDYGRAQRSMNRLDHLESALWKAHGIEANEEAICETQKMQVICSETRDVCLHQQTKACSSAGTPSSWCRPLMQHTRCKRVLR